MSAAVAQAPARLVERHSVGRIMAEAEVAGLPPKPTDPLGRYVAWVLLTMAPGFDYEGTWTNVTPAWIDGQIRRYKALCVGGYTSPILAEHTKAITRGERLGDVLELARCTIKGAPALAGALAFADEDAEVKIAKGRIKFVSPGFGSLRDEQGNEHEDVILEVSLVAGPHQKHMSTTHILASEEPAMSDNNPNPNPPTTVEDRLGKLEAIFGDLAPKIAEMYEKMMEQPPADEDEDEAKAPDMGEGEEKPEVAAMGDGEDDDDATPAAPMTMGERADRIGALEARLKVAEAELARAKAAEARASFGAKYPVGATITMSEDLVDAFFKLATSEPEALRKITSTAKAPVTMGEIRTPAARIPAAAHFDFGVRMGEGSAPSEGPDLSTPEGQRKRYDALCIEHGGDAVKAKEIFMAEMRRVA